MKTLRIKDIAELLSGYQVRDKTDFVKEGNINFIQVKNLDRINNRVSFKELEKLNMDKDMSKYQVKEDDVLFLAKGNIQASLIDKESFNNDEVYIPMSHFITLRPLKHEVLSEYLWWILNHKETQSVLNRLARGTMMPFIGRSELENLEIPVPSLQRQRFIVEFVRLREREKELAKKLELERDKVYDHILGEVVRGQYSINESYEKN